jgi:alkylation response protein AidB-like acyl-CoA dehydrogenase
MPGDQFALADAAMLIEAGRAFLFQEARAIVAKAVKGESFIEADFIRMIMAGLVARENAQKAVDRLFTIRGAHGLYETSNFERYYRDVRMVTLVAPTAPDLTREQIGKHFFGVAANARPRWG